MYGDYIKIKFTTNKCVVLYFWVFIMFKKIYLEITYNCNLVLSFCIGNKRNKKFIDIEQFNILLSKIEGFTKYVYFHVMGEPLLHPKIND